MPSSGPHALMTGRVPSTHSESSYGVPHNITGETALPNHTLQVGQITSTRAHIKISSRVLI